MSSRPSSVSITFSKHALERMATRGINRAEVLRVIECGVPRSQRDRTLRFAIDIGSVAWSTTADQSLFRLMDIEVVIDADCKVITCYHKQSAGDHASLPASNSAFRFREVNP